MNRSLQQINLLATERVLVYGIGNVGRQDDGLGVRLVERLESDLGNALEDGSSTLRPTFESNYQLSIEDALLLSSFDVVLFLDASCERNAEGPFTVRPLVPSDDIAFTTHALSFSSVLSMCEDLYGCRPRTFLIAIHGCEWDISEALSATARANLEEALDSLATLLKRREQAPRSSSFSASRRELDA